MPSQTVHRSLSFDTIITDHPHRLSAEAHMSKVLREYGDWPQTPPPTRPVRASPPRA
jgi:hypothetical protein